MRILVACEFSGIVRDAFIAAGHDAVSCDLLPTERPGPHHEGDVRELLADGWDLMVAHPPCTYLSRAGARWLYPGGQLDSERYSMGLRARQFFIALLNAPVPMIAVENPTPLRIFGLPHSDHAIQPWEFGDPYSKRTLLWLKGLPPLMPTELVDGHTPYVRSNSGAGRRAGQRWHRGQTSGGPEAARTFPGIARAMAEQWGRIL